MSALILLFVFFVSVPINQAQDDVPFPPDIFTYHDPQSLLAQRAPDDILIMATGDVLLARTINARMVERSDFTFPFAQVAAYLAQADLAWVNLETPLVTGCPLRYRTKDFCGDPRTVAALVSAGIDVANMANNHAENSGQKGVLETEQILNQAGIDVTGRTNVILEVQGKRIGLLGFNDISATRWVSRARAEDVEAQIKNLRDQVDYLIVCFHWGIEYQLLQNSRQRNLAEIAIDAGADVVVGHHPHWLQGVEIYHDKPIIYSLGNFIFDQKGGGWIDQGAIALITFQANGHVQLNFVPTIIEDRSTPRFATRDEAEDIMRRMASVSFHLDDQGRRPNR